MAFNLAYVLVFQTKLLDMLVISVLFQSKDWSGLTMTAKMRAAVKSRLLHNAPVVRTWPQASILLVKWFLRVIWDSQHLLQGHGFRCTAPKYLHNVNPGPCQGFNVNPIMPALL
jgi:hypothetical protein